jgi:hypothetical protein
MNDFHRKRLSWCHVSLTANSVGVRVIVLRPLLNRRFLVKRTHPHRAPLSRFSISVKAVAPSPALAVPVMAGEKAVLVVVLEGGAAAFVAVLGVAPPPMNPAADTVFLRNMDMTPIRTIATRKVTLMTPRTRLHVVVGRLLRRRYLRWKK